MDSHTLSALEFDVVRRKLADEAFTDPGRRAALALQPLPDPNAARWMQDETMEMRRAAAEEGRPPVDGLTDLAKVLVAARIEGHPLEPQELLAVAASLRAARAVLSWSSRIAWEHPKLDAIVGNVKAEAEAEKRITAAFDDAGAVADDASPELADVRKKIGKLEERIRRRLEDVIGSTKVWLQDTFMTVRNGRFVIPVKAGARTNVPGIVHDASDSGVTVYVEPAAVIEDGNDLAECRARERAEVRRILTALSDIVRVILPAVETNQRALAALDLAAARARFSERWNCVRAEIDDKCRVRLEGARHPALLFKGIDTVPIDVRLGDDFQVLVITGPNTGGKSVALKTVGLLHVMALAGLHIPAKIGARIGFFTNVCADIGDEQSIEQSLSTFSAHLKRITELLPAANSTTLVLLDELGAGTDPTEGGALGCAILEALLASGAKVIATTHLGDIKTFAATTAGVVNGSVLFDVQTLRPMYTLTIGIPGQSNAFAIARRLGLLEEVVKRAEAFVGGRERLLERAIGGLSAARDEAERDRVAMGKARADAEIAEARAKAKIQDAVEEKRSAMEAAAREAAELVGRARAEVQSALDDVRQKRVAPKEAQRRLDSAHREMAQKAHQLERPGTPLAPGEVKPGMAVHLRSLSQDGVVLAVRGGKGRATVSCGGMEIEVALEDLVRGEAPRVEAGAPAVHRSAPEAPREIDLRGLRVEEAQRRIGKEIDVCLRAGCESVRVIHGFGTGALGQAATEFLRRHPQVSHFRTGKADEGGGGVLVVTFRA
ncbi:MAG: DNA mismatch repair protein [Planctomycetota bacterium]|nr:MAG: DNA mismatch repair protein [Planctomycetota bacterium]